MPDPWSWTSFFDGLLEGFFLLVVLPAIAFALMGGAFACAVAWSWTAAGRLRDRPEAGPVLLALAGAGVATAVGAALAWFLWFSYLVPIASQVGR